MEKSVFRIHLKSGSKKDKEDKDYDKKRSEMIQYCIKENIFGFGWGLNEKDFQLTEIVTIDEKKRLYDIAGDIHKKAKGAVHKAINAMYKCDESCYIWTRDMDNIYYLGKVSGPYEYSSIGLGGFDINHYRKCIWKKIGTNVPGKVISSFAPRATIQRINSQEQYYYCDSLWNDKEFDISKEHLFYYFDPFDVEDLVGIYLEHEKNYLLIPNSIAQGGTTLKFEYELINKHTGKHAVVQVKTGNVSISCYEYLNLAEENDVYLFFESENYDNMQLNGIHCIKKEELLNFMKTHFNILPKPIQHWVNMVNF